MLLLEIFTDAGIGTMVTVGDTAPGSDRAVSAHAFATDGLDACPYWPVFGPPQVMFVRGRGTELWDDQGRRYLDFLCGLAVTSLGHAHPAVADAIATQAETLLHVSNFFANPVATETAVMLDDLLGGGGQVFFCNSGAEANEAAFKLARKFGGRGRHVVVSALGSFHGRTLAALAATGQPTKHEPFQPMPEGFRHVPFGDLDALAGGGRRAAWPPCSSSRSRARAGSCPRRPATCEGIRELCDERGRADDPRRGPDRPRPHRPLVRLRARRRPAGRRVPRQGPRQRHAHRRLLGPSRRRRGAAAGRPRLDVQRHADRHGGGAGRADGDAHGSTRRRWPDAAGDRLRRGPGGDARGDGRAGPRAAAGGRARRARQQGGRRRLPGPRAGRQQRDPDRAALRPAADRQRRRDRRGGRPS